jgi:hypothetical protein
MLKAGKPPQTSTLIRLSLEKNFAAFAVAHYQIKDADVYSYTLKIGIKKYPKISLIPGDGLAFDYLVLPEIISCHIAGFYRDSKKIVSTSWASNKDTTSAITIVKDKI